MFKFTMYKKANIYGILLFYVVFLLSIFHPILQAQTTTPDTTVSILVKGKYIAKDVQVFFGDTKLEQIRWIAEDMMMVNIPPYLVNRYLYTGDLLKKYIFGSLKAQNPKSKKQPSEISILINRIPRDSIQEKIIGRWNQKIVKLFISNELPQILQQEVRTAIQAYNDIGADFIIETDTTSERPSLAIPDSSTRDNKSVIGFAEPPSQDSKFNSISGWTVAYPPKLVNQNPKNRIFTEVDIAINSKMYLIDSLLKIGNIPNNEIGISSNITWVIAHELGHFLGLQDIFMTLGQNPDGNLTKYTWENSIMPQGVAPSKWINSIPDREKNLLKIIYGTKKFFTVFR